MMQSMSWNWLMYENMEVWTFANDNHQSQRHNMLINLVKEKIEKQFEEIYCRSSAGDFFYGCAREKFFSFIYNFAPFSSHKS